MNHWRIFILAFFILAATCSFADELHLRFTRYSSDDGLSQNSVLAIAQDKYGFMWFGTWEGLSRFDGYEFRVFRAVANNPGSITNNRINALITDDAGNIWVSSGDNRYFFRFDYRTEQFERFVPESVDSVIRVKLNTYASQRRSVANNEYRWQAGRNRLLQTNLHSGKTVEYKPDIYSPFALRDEVVNVLFIDKSNLLWVGTQHGGVHVANLNSRHFGYLRPGISKVSGNVVRAIHQDNAGRVWVGTDSEGITVFDRSKGEAATRVFGKESLIDPNIRYIYADRTGQIWIGTKGGLDRYNPATGRFRHYFARQEGSINHPWVFFITEDFRGDLWFGTFAGLARYNRADDRFINYTDAPFLNSNSIRYILEDRNRDLWIATEGAGITHLRRDTTGGVYDRFNPVHYRFNEHDMNSLINDLVLSLQEDEYGFIWIGTNSGLCRLNPQTGDFLRFSVATGFPDDLIMGMIADHKGHVWISHKKGITRMNTQSLRTRTYNRYDGLQGDEFLQNACFYNPQTGEIFFGGTRGVNYFFPDQIKPVSGIPSPVLTSLHVLNQQLFPGVEIGGRMVLEKSLIMTRDIELKHADTYFSISFSSLDFSNPQSCKYKYRLVGAHSEWIYTDASKRDATYSHLPAGNYRFEMHAANSDGVWSKDPVVLNISILPPWWMSWWAKLIYGLLIVLAGWMLYRYLVARFEFRNQLALEQHKNEKNEELTNMKIQFFTEISHEFRTPLSLIIEPLNRLMEEETDEAKRQYYYQLMSRNAKQLLELINQLLDFRKLQSGKMKMHFVSGNLVSFARNATLAFEQKARDKQVRFVLLSNLDVIEVHFDHDKMHRVLNNLIANAFRFTPDFGEIIVRVYLPEKKPGFVCIVVEDNGPGIPEDQREKIFDAFYQSGAGKQSGQGTGLGLALSKELVLLHGGEIAVDQGYAGGARFNVCIPLVQEEVVTGEFAELKQPDTGNSVAAISGAVDMDSEKKPLLLLVDDHEDIRQYIIQQLSGSFRVVAATDGLEGYQKACELIPDIIVSDVMMPGIDGNELCRRLKADEQTRLIPVVLLTSRNTDASRIEGYETGADAYITKPFNRKVLESRVKNLLEQRKQWQKNYTESPVADARRVPINITDEAFLAKVSSVVFDNMENSDFEAGDLAEILKLSRTQLYRRIRAITNRSVHDFIITLRMNQARELLLSGNFSISETAYKVGYSLPTNFTRTFAKYFGMSPSKYIGKYRK